MNFYNLFHNVICKLSLYFKFIFRYIFNVDQIVGYTPDYPDLFNPKPNFQLMMKELVTKSKAIIHEKGDRAFYSCSDDYIQVPPKSRFIDTSNSSAEENFYSTLLHELVHWTGHKSRCDRVLFNKKGSEEYAFEELIAEIGNAILTTTLNQKLIPDNNHAKYLNSWLSVLKNDFSFFTEALELARFSVNWLLINTGVHPYILSPLTNRSISTEKIDLLKELIRKF